MKIAKISAALALAGLASTSQAVNLLSEGFDDVSTLSGSGWVLANVSSPSSGTPWFQGDNTTAFSSQSGAANSYIASNYLAAPPGGFIDNFLITPYFSLASDVTLTFYARGDGSAGAGFSDTFAVLAGSTALGGSEMVTEVLAPTVATVDGWTQYTVTLSGVGGGGVGRFAFEYFGSADTSNYMGIDTVAVAVPEPETYALMALGLAALALRRRKSA
ncbi:choice-of-anchor J family PEP-CTERM protein [Piscinibacter terrae]|uniref:PEP-CTERM sorting domain-containing protein n=1 Tax=Piscinibacter terrae TaxID=2496871 RepID=A0A3N7J4A4_9BURK|nr:choice-of-anchor J domain-containing protein [Albitalea terrae]RQP25682.1 PEP-CTERM sorting domain-containing protein [Albitalea terrae]